MNTMTLDTFSTLKVSDTVDLIGCVEELDEIIDEMYDTLRYSEIEGGIISVKRYLEQFRTRINQKIIIDYICHDDNTILADILFQDENGDDRCSSFWFPMEILSNKVNGDRTISSAKNDSEFIRFINNFQNNIKNKL